MTVYETPADFPALAALDDSYMGQEYVPGTAYAVNLFLDRTATVVAVMEKPGRCERANGRAATVRQVTAPDVAVAAVAAARALGLTGPLDMEIRRRAYDCPAVLNINARFGATIAYAPQVLLLAVNREPSFDNKRPATVRNMRLPYYSPHPARAEKHSAIQFGRISPAFVSFGR
ncbi:MAG: hypothetical protein D8M54_14690 [Chloroflexi bacterium]|nr:hypothetical protein [Chloroflexota bacterium]